MFSMFRSKKFRQTTGRSKTSLGRRSLEGRYLQFETMEGRLVLSASGFAGNECAPEFDNTQMASRVPSGPFSPGTNIAFSFDAADVVSDAGVGATATEDIRFILDPDIDANFRNNGSTPTGATLTANDPGSNDQWDFAWTPTDLQVGTFRLFIIATDLGGDGSAGPVVPLSDVFLFSIEVDNSAVVDLNGDGDGENDGIDFGPVSFTEGSDPVNIVDTDATIPFAVDNTVVQATIELLNPQSGDALGVDLPSGSLLEVDASSTDSRLVLTVSGAATEADKSEFELALRELTFVNTSDEPGSEQRNIAVTINDGVSTSEAAMTTVDTFGTNDRPVLTPDDGQLPDATVGVPYTFEVIAADPDAGDLLTFQISDQPTPPSQIEITPNAGAASSDTTVQIARGDDGLFRATVSWTPTEADLDAGTIEIGILVDDTGTSGITSDFEIYSINIVNQSPTTGNDPETVPTTSEDDFAVDENNADDIGNVLANDSDPDGDSLTIEAAMTTDGGDAVADPTSFTTEKGGLVTIDAAGNVNYDPNGMFETLAAGDTDTDEFWYTVSDGRGGVSSPAAKVTVTIFGRNDVPQAITTDIDPNFTTPEFAVNETDGPTALDTSTILLAAFDVDQGDVLSLAGAPADTADGSFSFTAPTNGPSSAILEFDPAEDPALVGGATKNVDVLVEVEDAAGETAMVPIRIVVTGVAVGPTANDDSGVTQIDTAVALNVTDNDDDGDVAVDPATVDLEPATAGLQTTTSVTGEGTFTVDAQGEVTFAPETGFVGTSTIAYTVNDAQGETSNSANISVRVNAAPTAVDDSAQTAGETSVSFSVTSNDTDPDGTIDPATVDLDPTTANPDIIIGVQGEGSFSVNNSGEVIFAPEAGFRGTSSIEYIVSDNDGATSQAATISVLVNDPPVAVDDDGAGGTQSTDEDTELTVSTPGILDNDTDDSDPVSIQVAEFTYSEETMSPGATITDESGSELTVNADGSFSFDPVQAFQSLNTSSDPAEVTFTYKVQDALGAQSADATVTISVSGLNDAPTAADVSADAMEGGGAITANFAGTDVDDEDSSLTYEITSTLAAGEGTVNLGTTPGTFEYDPGDHFQELAEGQTAMVSFNYKAIDQALAESSEATATVTITGVNDPPEFDVPALATELGGTVDNGVIRVSLGQGATLMVDLSMFVSDVDGEDDDIVISRAANIPGSLDFGDNDPALTTGGELSWTANADQQPGEYIFRMNAGDSALQDGTVDIIVTVTAAIP